MFLKQSYYVVENAEDVGAITFVLLELFTITERATVAQAVLEGDCHVDQFTLLLANLMQAVG